MSTSPALNAREGRARAAAGDVRWLDDAEMSAWLPLLRVVQLLPQALDRQLREQAGVNHAYYSLLAILSAQPDQRLPLTELARAAATSPSRTSHAVTALAGHGWVTRTACPSDRRIQYVQLTNGGDAALRQHAPGHVAEVRRLVFDRLDPADIDRLREISLKVLAPLDAGSSPTASIQDAAPNHSAPDQTRRHRVSIAKAGSA